MKTCILQKGWKKGKIGEKLGCHRQTVSKWLDEYDIQRAWEDYERLYEMYVEKRMSADKIGQELGCSGSCIIDHLEKAGIERDKARSMTNDYASYAKTSDGYRYWIDHSSNSASIYVHRLLGVAKYGVDAVKGMDVHHKNGVRWDNRVENIEIIDKTDHGRMHGKERGN